MMNMSVSVIAEVPAASQVPSEVASEESNADIAVGTGSYIKHAALAS